MARVQLIVAALALSLVAVSAIPVKLIKTEVVNKPAPKGCTLYNTSATCVDDKCGPFPRKPAAFACALPFHLNCPRHRDLPKF